MNSTRSGFTLIEVILAVMILGAGLSVIFRSIIVNARSITISREREDVAYVFSLGELTYPLRNVEDIEEDVPIAGDSSLVEGYTYARTVDDKQEPQDGVEDDGLYVVRTTVSWANDTEREEVIRYLRKVQ